MDGEQFDFIKGFVGVDILTVEAVAKLVGAAIAGLYNGMTGAGLPPQVALQVIISAQREFYIAFNDLMRKGQVGGN